MARPWHAKTLLARETSNPMTSRITLRNNAVLWLLISIIFTAAVIHQSLRQGQLALPPTYDDIVYFNDALTRLNIFYDQGFKALFLNFIEKPPHSPIATIVPLIGFSIFGVHNWAPPVINGIFVFFLLVFLDYISPGISRLGKIIIACISLTWPITGQLIIECRPDFIWGLSTASFTVLSLKENTRITRASENQFIIGGLIGFSLLAKPSIFPITLIAAISCLSIASLADLYQQNLWHRKRTVFVANARCLAVASTIALPYYLLAYKQVYAYIYDVVFSSNASMWDPNSNLTLTDNLTYYLTATSGQITMGRWFYVWVFLVFLSLAALFAKRDWQRLSRFTPLAGGFLVLYLLVTVPKLKMHFFGASLYFFILLTLILLTIEIFRTLRPKRPGLGLHYGFIVIILLFGLNKFQWPLYNTSKQSEVLSSEVQYRRKAINSLYDDILSNQKKSGLKNDQPIKIFFTTSNKFLNSYTLQFYFGKQNIKNLTTDLYLSGDLKLYSDSINLSDYVVAFSADNTDTFPWLPSSKIQKQVLDMLNSNPDFKLIQTYADPYSNNRTFLFGRTGEKPKQAPTS